MIDETMFVDRALNLVMFLAQKYVVHYLERAVSAGIERWREGRGRKDEEGREEGRGIVILMRCVCGFELVWMRCCMYVCLLRYR